MEICDTKQIRSLNSSSLSSTGETALNVNASKVRIATWNVRDLIQTGKLYIVEREAEYRAELMGLAETQ